MTATRSSLPPLDRVVQTRGTSIRVRDHGGDGPPVLLLHGAGRTLADWASVAPRLAVGHRVVAVDLRGHGGSGDGPWTWEAVLTDLADVIDELGWARPAVVGHSLGGMIAAQWAASVNGCAAAVNLDGHGRGRPEQYVDIPAATVRRRWAELDALRPVAATASVPPGDGEPQPRPSPATRLEMHTAIQRLDLLATYAASRCPLLVVNAVAPGSEAAQVGRPWAADFFAAYRRGITRDLQQLSGRCSNVRMATMDADHGLILLRPAAVADLILDFLADVG